MSYDEAIQFLHGLRMFGARFGLDNTRTLAALADHPEEKLRFIHVAGTNGKGSTCAMLESIYRHAGWRTGLFTSPHLVSFNERIQVNRQPIPERELARLVTELQPLAARLPAEAPVTMFEFVTVLALRYFAEQRCDLVLWETGLGGRLDATNIVTPLASVITNIDFDHQQWLGNTLDKIAAEKAGIIKPGVPVVTAAESGRGLEVIADAARQNQAPLLVVGQGGGLPSNAASDTTFVTVEEACSILESAPAGQRLPFSLRGDHQRLNAAVALTTVRRLEGEMSVSESALREGLSDVAWPGRLQRVTLPSGQTVLLDGAHNAASALALRRFVLQEHAVSPPALVLGVLGDKDWEMIASTLAPLSRRILVVPVQSQRTLAPELLIGACRAANADASLEVCASLAEALQRAAEEKFLLITGSLYLVGEAIELLQLSPNPPGDERGLNEWGGVPP